MTEYIRVSRAQLEQLRVAVRQLELATADTMTKAMDINNLLGITEATWQQRVDQVVDLMLDETNTAMKCAYANALKVLRP